jgi:hypothetical protein
MVAGARDQGPGIRSQVIRVQDIFMCKFAPWIILFFKPCKLVVKGS